MICISWARRDADGRGGQKFVFLRGCKLRGFDQNQVNHSQLFSQNVRNIELSSLANFNLKPPTHIDATHAISKFGENFQNRIPKELDQNFYIPGISTSH